MHTEIKTYQLIGNDGEPISFKIQAMDEIYLRMAGQQDSPHRHDYYTIILIHEAQGKHYVDFKSYELSGNIVFFIHPGQVHQFLTKSAPKGWVLTFNQEFLVKNGISDQLINDVYLYNNYGESPPLPLHQEEADSLTALIIQMLDFNKMQNIYELEAMGSFLKLLLIKSNNICSLSKGADMQVQETGNVLYRKFKQYIDIHYADKHKVSDYADLLSVSSDYLNKVVKMLTGKSAKDYIQNKLIIEAKRNLLFADLSNKELAYQLGFEEPAHFSNFFKKHSGASPSDFRSAARQN